ncbi:MAG: MFS transporter [Planctomycetaceae bacterium]|jgi:MFS family permease|nr:MFS transporter [Planctomycetaceae bacterium]
MKRWLILLLGMLANIAQGMAYAGSVISAPMLAHANIAEGLYKSHWAGIFTLSIVFLPLGMVTAGKLAERFSPRVPIILGAVLYGSGMLAAAYATNYTMLCFSFGFMLSIGSGLAYGPIVASAVRWFPDKKGLASGLVVGALGFGPVLIAPLCAALLQHGWHITSLLIACGVFCLIAIGLAAFITSPPDGYAERFNKLPQNTPQGGKPQQNNTDLVWYEMILTGNFWILFILFFFGTAPGLMIISAASGIFQSIGHFDAQKAATLVAVLAAANAFGRFLWGTVSDYIGRVNALLLMFILSAAATFLLPMSANPLMLVAVIFVIGTTYGGYLGLFPSFCAEMFGLKNMALNYAVLFIAFAAAALAGPRLYASFDEPLTAFYIAAALALAGCILTAVFRITRGGCRR